jgi:SNF2 family DNA or RNA helicase
LSFRKAHIIRRMTTKLFKATKKLRAKLRWCLTGTPIQNSLEDLAALINFIRSSPLEDLYMFKKHIISPLMKNSQKGVENLRQLLDSVCLRRTKQLLDLPEVVTEPRLLNFSPEEKNRGEGWLSQVFLVPRNHLRRVSCHRRRLIEANENRQQTPLCMAIFRQGWPLNQNLCCDSRHRAAQSRGEEVSLSTSGAALDAMC